VTSRSAPKAAIEVKTKEKKLQEVQTELKSAKTRLAENTPNAPQALPPPPPFGKPVDPGFLQSFVREYPIQTESEATVLAALAERFELTVPNGIDSGNTAVVKRILTELKVPKLPDLPKKKDDVPYNQGFDFLNTGANNVWVFATRRDPPPDVHAPTGPRGGTSKAT